MSVLESFKQLKAEGTKIVVVTSHGILECQDS